MKALLLPLLLASTCAAASVPAYVTFKGVPPRLNPNGYTIRLPQAGLWVEHNARDSVVYIRETDERESTMFVSVEDVAMPQAPPSEQALRDFVHARVEPAGAADRVDTEPVTTRLRTDARLPDCVRWRQTAVDLMSVNPVTRTHPHVQSGGLFCVNAHNRAAAIHVYYSIRRMAPERPDGLTAEGEAFLSGVRRKTP